MPRPSDTCCGVPRSAYEAVVVSLDSDGRRKFAALRTKLARFDAETRDRQGLTEAERDQVAAIVADAYEQAGTPAEIQARITRGLVSMVPAEDFLLSMRQGLRSNDPYARKLYVDVTLGGAKAPVPEEKPEAYSVTFEEHAPEPVELTEISEAQMERTASREERKAQNRAAYRAAQQAKREAEAAAPKPDGKRIEKPVPVNTYETMVPGLKLTEIAG